MITELELSEAELNCVAGGYSCWRFTHHGWVNVCYRTPTPGATTTSHGGTTTSQPTSEPTLQHETPHAA